MKMQLKMDKQALQEFGLQHSEKIVAGLVVLIFLVFIYQAIARPSFPQTPQSLKDAAQRASEHIAATPGKADDLPLVDYKQRAVQGRTRTEESQYATIPWKPPLFPEKRKRIEPKLNGVQELVGTAEAGPIEVKVAGGAPAGAAPAATGEATPVKGAHWIMLTALVPVADQKMIYKEAFRDYPHPEGDKPVYTDYAVERAEVTGPADTKLDWQPVNLDDAWGRRNQWSGPAQEVAPPVYVNELLTFPLPPRKDHAWDAKAVHPPIPALVPEGSSAAPVGPATGQATGPAAAPTGPEAPSGRPRPRATAPESAPAAPEAQPGAAPGTAPVPAAETTEEAKYLLFRFFDFAVTPGKQYRYHVRLVLHNPNHKVDYRELVSRDLGTKENLETKWSDPSEPITVPLDDQLLLYTVQAPYHIWDEPRIIVWALKWMEDRGNRVGQAWKIVRGQLTNFPEGEPKELKAVDRNATPEKDPVRKTAMEPRPLTRRPGPGDKHINYESYLVLLDIQGGDRLPRESLKDKTAVAIGQVLLMDRKGNLIVRNELDDTFTYDVLAEKPAGTAATTIEPTPPTTPPLLGSEFGQTSKTGKPPKVPRTPHERKPKPDRPM